MRMSAFSCTGTFAQVGWAALAYWTAALMSSSVAEGMVSMSLPVAGLVTSMVAPSEASAGLPFRNIFMAGSFLSLGCLRVFGRLRFSPALAVPGALAATWRSR